MRVTKLIREYVTEEVKKAYAPKIESVFDEYHKERDYYTDLIKIVVDEAKERIASFLPENYTSTYHDTIISHYDIWDKERYYELREAKREIERERDEKIKDVLINLELGATRADLDKMLSEI